MKTIKKSKAVKAWTRWAIKSPYGIGAFLFIDKNNALEAIGTAGNCEVVRVEIREVSK